jgi:hypothetical protein
MTADNAGPLWTLGTNSGCGVSLNSEKEARSQAPPAFNILELKVPNHLENFSAVNNFKSVNLSLDHKSYQRLD